MMHKNCGGTIMEIEFTCAVQLYCDRCRKKWQLFDSLDDIVGAPEGHKLIDSFPIGHMAVSDIPFAVRTKDTWNRLGKKLRYFIDRN